MNNELNLSFKPHWSLKYAQKEIVEIADLEPCFDREAAIGFRYTTAENIEGCIISIFNEIMKVETSILTNEKENLAREKSDRDEFEKNDSHKDFYEVSKVPHRFIVIKETSHLQTTDLYREVFEKIFKKVLDINAEFVLIGKKGSKYGFNKTYELRLSWPKINHFTFIAKEFEKYNDRLIALHDDGKKDS